MTRQRRDKIDTNTKNYIRQMRLYQLLILIIIVVSFILFAKMMVSSNQENLKKVALAEVQESMRETVNNIAIHVDMVRERMDRESVATITDLVRRIKAGGVTSAEDILEYLRVCEENKLGQAIEIIYTSADGIPYYINQYESNVLFINGSKDLLLKDAAIKDVFMIDGQELIVFIRQSEVDGLVKKEIHDYLHRESYEGNQYVWVNEVINLDGGPYYAIRRIHPNLVESEGEFLSTHLTDVMGNYPYKTELEGINKEGYVFHSYYFKNKVNNDITEKFSYAQYYEPYNWIIAIGETIEDTYAYSEEINTRNIRQVMVLLIVFVVLFMVTSGTMIGLLGKQAKEFRLQLLKQSEVVEDMFTTMSVGILRIRMTDTETTVIRVNPKALELLGVETEEELISKIKGNAVTTIEDREEAVHIAECLKLNEKWQSVVTECPVHWKDGSRHLLRIRDMVVEIDGDTRTIQRVCLDITEERRKHEEELSKAEEKATLDPMTQIKNKKAIEMAVRAQIIEAAEKNLPIAVGFVDIDNFRDYNTKYGHMQGDEVIKYVASTVKEFIPGTVGRNGGDEFAFVILDTSYEQVEAAMKVIHKKLNEGIVVKDTGEQIATPCSIGVVLTQSQTLNYDDVMEQSDEAMYEAKARGKNTYHIFVP